MARHVTQARARDLDAARGRCARRPPARRRARAPGRPAHEPAGLGPRAHRRLRGPLARAPPRRRAAAAPRPRRASTTPSRRRAPCAATIELLDAPGARGYLADVRARTLAAIERARHRPGHPRDGPAPRAPAHRDDAPGDAPRRPAARRASRRSTPAGRARTAGSTFPAGPFAHGRRRRRLRLRQRAPAPRASTSPPSAIARRPVTNAHVAALRRGRRLRAPRVVDATRAGRGRRTTTSRHCPRRRRTGTRTPRSATSPGSRPTPSPARTALGSPPRRSGRRRRPGGTTTAGGLRASDRSGSGRRRSSAGYPGFVAHPYREYSEVFFGGGHRVLRGGSWATAPARRHPDVPQLGPPAAPADLRRRAAGPRRGGLMEPLLSSRTRSSSSPTSGRATSARWPTTSSTA